MRGPVWADDLRPENLEEYGVEQTESGREFTEGPGRHAAPGFFEVCTPLISWKSLETLEIRLRLDTPAFQVSLSISKISGNFSQVGRSVSLDSKRLDARQTRFENVSLDSKTRLASKDKLARLNQNPADESTMARTGNPTSGGSGRLIGVRSKIAVRYPTGREGGRAGTM